MNPASNDQETQVVARNPFADGFPLSGKVLAGIVAFLSVLSVFFKPVYKTLALVPANTIQLWVWNLLTCNFIEYSIIGALVSAFLALSICKSLEPLWGTKELFRFIIIVDLATSFTTFCLLLVLYAISGSVKFLITPISGFSAAVGAYTIAMRQLAPENEITLFGSVKLRAKNFAGLFILVSVLMAVLFGSVQGLPFVFFGVYYSWIYLRMFQKRPDGSVGDPSEAFSFAVFFPEPVRPTMAKISTLCTSCVGWITCGRIRQFSPETDVESGDGHRRGLATPASGPATFSSNDLSDADRDRRRERALKALNLRFGATDKKTDGDSSNAMATAQKAMANASDEKQ